MDKKNFSLRKALFVTAMLTGCILINMLGRSLAGLIQKALWLDCIGTCLSAYYLGPAGAVLTGIATNLIVGYVNSEIVFYAIISAVIGLIFCLCAKKGKLESMHGAFTSSYWAGMVSVLLSTVLNQLLNGGMTGNGWADAFYQMLEWYEWPSALCTLGAEFFIEIPDKQICVLVACLLIHLLRKLFPGRGYYEREKTHRLQAGPAAAGIAAVLLLLSIGNHPVRALAETEFFAQNHHAVIYDGSTGMPSSEANVIAETADGYLYIGSYAGLTRYDGTNFELITEANIASVTAMITDSSDRLWIGTNDNGVICFDHGVYTAYTKENGLTDNAIRSLAEGRDGSVYIGTTDRISCISPDGTVSGIDAPVYYVYSLMEKDGSLYGVTNTGRAFRISREMGIVFLSLNGNDQYFTCIADTPLGLLAGTSGQQLALITESGSGMAVEKMVDIDPLLGVDSIQMDSAGRIWLCADNGLGYLDENGALHVGEIKGFVNSVEMMHEDYEGNLWFVSSRCGVLKLVRNQFSSLFSAASVKNEVANAVVDYHGELWCGTDAGLVILDDAGKPVSNELTEMLSGIRIRSFLIDSQDNLWIATYSKYGLIRYGADGTMTTYNIENGATADRFRCMLELSDGTIAAGTSDGLNMIRDGMVIQQITAADGLRNTQILCLRENADGTLYVGTDGAGIYLVRDGYITGNITRANGLTSDVVMRMTPCDDGFFCVTSNALCYLKDGKAWKINHFPNFNNYDILIRNGTAYVLGSSGIYVASAQDMLSGESFAYKLYNYGDGLQSGLTANAWNCWKDDSLLLCCNDGVICWENQERMETEYRFGLTEVRVDGTEILPQDNDYLIPASAREIVIRSSVRNYSLTNVKVCLYVEGLQGTRQVVSQNNIHEIRIANLMTGTYTLHMQIVSDDESEVLQEKTYTLTRQSRLWEKREFIIYAALVGIWFVIATTSVVINGVNQHNRRKERAELSDQLQIRVEEQTLQIRTQAEKIQSFQWSVIEGMASLIESRDGNTGLHVIHTRDYVKKISEEILRRNLYPEIMDERYLELLVHAAPLHDVGKIKISDTILNKPGRLTEEEFNMMKLHSVYGAEIIDDILVPGTDDQLKKMAREVALSHHERYDGKGYPNGLKGEEIPLSARIMALADVYDALVSKRVYKEPIPPEKAWEIIRENAGTQFDPQLAEIFLSLEILPEE